MSAIDNVVTANGSYASTFELSELSHKPRKRLAVVTCMDTRIEVEKMLGLHPGEANILRNAGAIVTEDVIRSLIISHQQLGSEEIMIIGHTNCGATGFENEEFVNELIGISGSTAVSPGHFLNFHDVEMHTRQQVLKVRSHPWISDSVTTRGFIYDVETGKLTEIQV
ncbi:beta-class carbonic anhydrase [candidate division KSB1 bacterium]